jgi:hypothetical protein
MCKLTFAIGNTLGGLFGCVTAYEDLLCSTPLTVLSFVWTLNTMLLFQLWKES